jgi:hypothetical protein
MKNSPGLWQGTGNPGSRPLSVLLAISGFLAVLLCSSCVSGSGRGSWYAYPELPAYWDYRTGEVQVIVDHAPEEGLSSQVAVMAEAILASGGKKTPEADIRALIDIKIEQRSFLHRTELFNAVTIACRVRDEQGRVFGSEYRYLVGKRNIVSAKEQHRLLKGILKKVIAGQRKRRWELVWYRRTHA